MYIYVYQILYMAEEYDFFWLEWLGDMTCIAK